MQKLRGGIEREILVHKSEALAAFQGMRLMKFL
jgi:hypothetical protein